MGRGEASREKCRGGPGMHETLAFTLCQMGSPGEFRAEQGLASLLTGSL